MNFDNLHVWAASDKLAHAHVWEDEGQLCGKCVGVRVHATAHLHGDRHQVGQQGHGAVQLDAEPAGNDERAEAEERGDAEDGAQAEGETDPGRDGERGGVGAFSQPRLDLLALVLGPHLTPLPEV